MTTFQLSALFDKHFYLGFCWRTLVTVLCFYVLLKALLFLLNIRMRLKFSKNLPQVNYWLTSQHSKSRTQLVGPLVLWTTSLRYPFLLCWAALSRTVHTIKCWKKMSNICYLFFEFTVVSKVHHLNLVLG